MRSKIGEGEFKRFFKVLKTLFIMGKTNRVLGCYAFKLKKVGRGLISTLLVLIALFYQLESEERLNLSTKNKCGVLVSTYLINMCFIAFVA